MLSCSQTSLDTSTVPWPHAQASGLDRCPVQSFSCCPLRDSAVWTRMCFSPLFVPFSTLYAYCAPTLPRPPPPPEHGTDTMQQPHAEHAPATNSCPTMQNSGYARAGGCGRLRTYGRFLEASARVSHQSLLTRTSPYCLKCHLIPGFTLGYRLHDTARLKGAVRFPGLQIPVTVRMPSMLSPHQQSQTRDCFNGQTNRHRFLASTI